ERGGLGRGLRAAVGEAALAARPRARRRRRLEDRGAPPPDRALGGSRQDPRPRLRGARCRSRAVPRRRGLRLPVPLRGVRPAGAGGHGVRPSGRGVHRRCPARGRRRRATSRAPPRPRDARRADRARPRRRAAARAMRDRGPRACCRVLLGGGRREDGRGGGRGRGGVRVSSERRPRIGFDARKLTHFGIGSYIRNLLEAIGRSPASEGYRFRIYVPGRDREAVPVLPDHFEIVEEDSPGYSVAELTGFAWRLMRDRLVLFPATHYVIPPLYRARAVVTIHDIIHVLY